MNEFQTIESGKGLLKDSYEEPKDQFSVSDILKERRDKLKKTLLEREKGRYIEAK